MTLNTQIFSWGEGKMSMGVEINGNHIAEYTMLKFHPE